MDLLHISEQSLNNHVEFLAWVERCLFPHDFSNDFYEYLVDHGWDDNLATLTSVNLSKEICKRGVIKTYQTYIQDKELCSLLLGFIYNQHVDRYGTLSLPTNLPPSKPTRCS